MKKILSKLIFATSMFLVPVRVDSGEVESVNYIPSTIDRVVVEDSYRGVALAELSPAEKRARVVNSIFLYEGYDSLNLRGFDEEHFLDRCISNLEEELKGVSSVRFVNNEDYSNFENLEEFPYEREVFSAFGKTLIERYKIAREVDSAVQKLRDSTTVSFGDKSGIRYRAGLFVGESDLGAAGIFLKVKANGFSAVGTGCQNEFEGYLEKVFKKFNIRGGCNYKTGADGDEKEWKFYFSFEGLKF